MSAAATRVGLLQVCLAGILWGTGGLGVQVVRDVAPMSALSLSAWRMAIAALVLVAVLLAMRRLPEVVALARAHPGRVVLVGCGTAAYQALYFGSVIAVGVSVSTVIALGMAPVLLTVAEALRLRRAPSRSRVVVLVVALTGLVMVSGAAGSGEPGPHPALGILLAVASGATYAATTAFGRGLAQVTGPLTLATATTTVGAVVLLPGAFLGGSSAAPFEDPVVAITVVYLGVFTMALAYALLYAGLRTTPGSAAVIATLLEPVTAAVLAALWLDERIGPVGVAGTVLILVAVAGLGRRATTTTGVVTAAP